MNGIRTSLLLIIFITIYTGCSPSLVDMPAQKPASLGYITSVHKELISLPTPKEKIVAAVYKFRDQTGQYKTSASGVSWSTAVTQGATSMLLKALEDSRWFTVIEREGLGNLLNERKIIRNSRENYSAQNGDKLPPLPPLLYAGVILEGGIISYETNTVTGGVGAKYFGIGASTQYRKDEVTIYLRAVSTQTGRVLKTVYTTKSILSMAVDVGVYRYIRFKRLLEVETGYSVNEPTQMCVLEAIEKAVYGLIIEGIWDNLWLLDNPVDIRSTAITDYLKEKESPERMIEYGLPAKSSISRFGIGADFAWQYYQGDYHNVDLQPAWDIYLKMKMASHLSLLLNGNFGTIADDDNFETPVQSLELKGIIAPFKKAVLSPFLSVGFGMMHFKPKDKEGFPLEIFRTEGTPARNYTWTASIGFGGEYFLTPYLSGGLSLDSHYLFTDQLDGLVSGNRNDLFWGGRLGLTWYFGK